MPHYQASYKTLLFLAFAFSFSFGASNAFAFPLFSDGTSGEFSANLITDAKVDMTGIVRLDGCSGSVISLTPTPNPKANAIVLTNGHCYDLQSPGTSNSHKPSGASMDFYMKDGSTTSHSAKQLLYSEMTVTDITLFEMNVTYAQLAQDGITPFNLATQSATPGTEIQMMSGYFNTSEVCKIKYVVNELEEDQWKFFNSYAYSDCHSIHGTSGSPLVSTATREIVGINNTHNDNGEKCTMDNPCEVDAQGNVTVKENMSYGQQTSMILGCVNAQGSFDLKTPGCALTGAN